MIDEEFAPAPTVTQPATIRRADEAVQLQRRQPYAMGPMVLAVRSLVDAGLNDRALTEAKRYIFSLEGDAASAERFVELVSRSRTRHFIDGEYVTMEGERADALYVVVSGCVAVRRDKSDETVARLHRGQAFGEAAVLGGYRRAASVRSEGGSSLLMLTRASLLAMGRKFVPFMKLLRAMHRNRTLAQLIPGHAILGALDAGRRHQLFSYFESRKASPTQVLIREGGKSPGFFVIATGKARVIRKIPNQTQPEQLAVLGPGDVFGEISLLENVPASATIEVTEALQYFVLWRAEFDTLMEDHPAQRGRIAQLASVRKAHNAGVDFEGATMMDMSALSFADRTMTCPVCGEEHPLAARCPGCGADVNMERTMALPAMVVDFEGRP